MNELKVIGKQQIGSIEFTGIEGGFGEDKKAMLVKDIADIHQKQIKHVNEVINRNLNRFKKDVDLIDLKVVVQNDHNLENFGFTKMQISKSPNLFLLSERGYAKLLKILEDDKAWEIYDELVDNYFNMRQTIKEDIQSNLSPELQMFGLLHKALANQELATKQLETKVDNISEIVALNTTDWRKETQNIVRRIANNQGGFGAYQELGSNIYKETERRAGANLSQRLTNKRRRMADEGASKSKRDKLNKLDVIADDKRLLEIYVAVVKDFAIKYGIDLKED